jgi:hypothetical protein
VREVKIQCSDNNKDWTDVNSGRSEPTRIVRWTPNVKNCLAFDEVVSARYVKILVASWDEHPSLRAGLM